MPSEGQTLRIPAGVIKNTHNAGTITPYDPASAIGDVSPTRPPRPKQQGFGIFAPILLKAAGLLALRLPLLASSGQ